MDHEIVDKLEQELKKAIADVVATRLGLKSFVCPCNQCST